MFAEHNGEVFRDLLCMDAEAIAQLYDSGVTSDEPIYAGPAGTL